MTERDISFTRANLAEDRGALLDINVEYGFWVASEMATPREFLKKDAYRAKTARYCRW